MKQSELRAAQSPLASDSEREGNPATAHAQPLAMNMTREFIYKDVGEFGSNHFYELANGKWRFIDLEVDCDLITVDRVEQSTNTANKEIK